MISIYAFVIVSSFVIGITAAHLFAKIIIGPTERSAKLDYSLCIFFSIFGLTTFLLTIVGDGLFSSYLVTGIGFLSLGWWVMLVLFAFVLK